MKLESRESYGLLCILNLLMLAQAALSGWTWGIAAWGSGALVWGFRWYRFDRDIPAGRPLSRGAAPNRRNRSMPWWAWVWAGAIVLLTTASASEEWNTGLPIRGLLDGALGLWCVVAVRAHFVGSMADRLGRVLLPASVLAIAWFLAACVVDYGSPSVEPDLSLVANVVVVVLDATILILVIGWPLVLGILNGLDYWSLGRLPKGGSVVSTNRTRNG